MPTCNSLGCYPTFALIAKWLLFVFSLCCTGISSADDWIEIEGAHPDQTRIAFGSCIFQPDSPAWQQLHQLKPDAVLLLGDNVYLRDEDMGDTQRISHRYQLLKDDSNFRTLMNAIPVFAIWDDHDYGPNNSNKDFPGRTASLRSHRMHWNTMLPKPFDDAIASHLKIGLAKVILADNRSYRDDPQEENASHFGDKQLDWVAALLPDVAENDFLIFASGGQILSPPGEKYETLGHYQNEQDRVVSSLAKVKSPTIILSGDRHYAEVLHARVAGKTIWELTSSPLSANTVHPDEISFYRERVFTFEPQRNFAVLTLTVKQNTTRAWVEYYSVASGKKLIRYELTNLSSH